MKRSIITDVMLWLGFWAAAFGVIRYGISTVIDFKDFEATQQMVLCLLINWLLLAVIAARNIGRERSPEIEADREADGTAPRS